MAKAKKPLGELEQLVLLALIRLGEAAYGVRVRDEIGRRTVRSLTLGSVYKTLLRLEEKGMVRAHQGEPTPERGGRRKTFYSVLPPGDRALQFSLAGIRRMTQGIDPVWEAP